MDSKLANESRKALAGGPQDFADARSALEAASQPPDLDLLHSLASRYDSRTAASLDALLTDLNRDLGSSPELE